MTRGAGRFHRGPTPRTRGSTGARGRIEWVGGRLSPPFVVEGGDAPYRAELALWLELPSDLVVGQEAFAPEYAGGAVGRALRQALERPLAGPRRRPDAIRVADAAVAAEVRGEVGDAIPITVGPTPELDALLAEMLDSMPGQDEPESYLERGRIPPEMVRKLFAAAELLYRAAPWKVAADDRLLRMDIPALGVEGACLSIVGNQGRSKGFVLFPSLADYEALLDAAECAEHTRGPVDFGTGWLAFELERGADLPASLRREVAAHGWPVAGAGAYPRVRRHDRDGAARPLVERDLAIAAACARALAACFLKHRTSFQAEEIEPVCESYFDEDELEVVVTMPYDAWPLFEIERSRVREPVAAAGGPGRVPRNAPCPCGSGRKYKKCCLPRDEEPRGARRGANDLHALDLRLVRALSEFAGRRHGAAWHRAFETFGDEPAVLQLAIPWMLYHHRIEGATVLDRYLDERGRRLSPPERAWLEAQRAAWLSVWEVTGVEPGERLALRDLLSGEARTVHEATASRTLVRRDAVLARVVDGDGVSLLCGLYPRPLPPFEAGEVVRRARAKLRRKGPVPPERLRDDASGRALIRRWEEAVARHDARSRVPRELSNTDGDPFLLTTDHFAVGPGARPAVLARLAALPGAERANPDEDPPVYDIVRPGNRLHASWDNTIVGRVAFAGQELRAETNSRKRADALRARLEAACGDLVRHRAREHADPLSERASRARREPPREPPSPEAQQLLLEFQQRHYAAWLDEPVPALGGKTPREAARTAQGRSAVDVLLKDFENREERREGGGPGFDFSALRRELRIDEGDES